ncbi:hypothetical protein LINPERHAP2_LOCUS21262 [Linum perenne]
MVVTRIGNHIGKTVRLDLATKEGARARYARVCVEVDISKPLLGKYMIGDRVYYVEYECLENLCYTCGVYGHKLEACPTTLNPKSTGIPKETVAPTESMSEPDHDTGSWMTVSRRTKGKSNKLRTIVQSAELGAKGSSGSGSRFVVLQQENHMAGEPSSIQKEPHVHPTQTERASADLILYMVALTEEIFAKPKTKACASQTQPLRDVTNQDTRLPTTKIGDGKPMETSSESLVTVPISFVNPIFESHSADQPIGCYLCVEREN